MESIDIDLRCRKEFPKVSAALLTSIDETVITFVSNLLLFNSVCAFAVYKELQHH